MKVKDNLTGQTVDVPTDKQGTPLARSWRRRFKAAKIDNNMEVIKTPKKTKKAKELGA